jgi:hypothetical protein
MIDPFSGSFTPFAHWQAEEIALYALSFVYPRGNQRIGGFLIRPKFEFKILLT